MTHESSESRRWPRNGDGFPSLAHLEILNLSVQGEFDPPFSSDFESGDLSAWSGVVP